VKKLLVALLLGLALGCGLLWLLLDASPAVEAPPAFGRRDIAWLQATLAKHDPRHAAPGTIQRLELATDEVNRLLNYATVFHTLYALEAELYPEGAIVSASLKLPKTPFGAYLNVSLELLSADGRVAVSHAQVGDVPLPGIVARAAGRLAWWLVRRDAALRALADSVRRVDFFEDRVAVDYEWQPTLVTLLQRRSAAVVVADADRERLLAYADAITRQVRHLPQGSSIPLTRVMQTVFGLAERRGGDAVAENRAAITALAAYVGGISLTKLIKGEGRTNRREPPVLPKLHGRRDFAQHYLIAAALAANGGSRLANALGLAKEEDDAQRGSGFSFTDLATDRAGARLGERLIGPGAAAVRRRLAGAASDGDLMPDFSDLPEFLPAAEFARRFGRVGGPRYRAMIETIDRRLDAHPLLGPTVIH
jgi:hypothetical protein